MEANWKPTIAIRCWSAAVLMSWSVPSSELDNGFSRKRSQPALMQAIATGMCRLFWIADKGHFWLFRQRFIQARKDADGVLILHVAPTVHVQCGSNDVLEASRGSAMISTSPPEESAEISGMALPDATEADH